MKTNAANSRHLLSSFFHREPRFSVAIALSAIFLMLSLYFCSSQDDVAEPQVQAQQTRLLSRPEVEQPGLSCSVKKIILIWGATRFLPAN